MTGRTDEQPLDETQPMPADARPARASQSGIQVVARVAQILRALENEPQGLSLSQIAKVMTGTSWNGHRFFGLREGGIKSKIQRLSRRKGAVKKSSDVQSVPIPADAP